MVCPAAFPRSMPARGATVVEPDRVQPRKPVAGAPGALWAWPGATEADRQLAADQLAATVGQDRWLTGQACPVLLADAGREPSGAAAVREHGATHCGVAGAERKRPGGEEANRTQEGGRRRGVRTRRSRSCPFPGHWSRSGSKKMRVMASTQGGLMYNPSWPGGENGNPG